jgi:hypothetical protein
MMDGIIGIVLNIVGVDMNLEKRRPINIKDYKVYDTKSKIMFSMIARHNKWEIVSMVENYKADVEVKISNPEQKSNVETWLIELMTASNWHNFNIYESGIKELTIPVAKYQAMQDYKKQRQLPLAFFWNNCCGNRVGYITIENVNETYTTHKDTDNHILVPIDQINFDNYSFLHNYKCDCYIFHKNLMNKYRKEYLFEKYNDRYKLSDKNPECLLDLKDILEII